MGLRLRHTCYLGEGGEGGVVGEGKIPTNGHTLLPSHPYSMSEETDFL